jgi:hypothetical protein
MDLAIPSERQRPLAALLHLMPQEAEALLAALRAAPPTLVRKDLSEHTAKLAGIDLALVSTILRLLIELYSVRVRNGVAPGDFATEILRAAEATGREDLLLVEAEKSRAKRFLTDLLSLDTSIGVTSKALDVMREHAHVFQDARIVSDLRPLFKEDAAEPPAAALIVHTLKIGYKERGEGKSFYVALDSDALLELKSVIERAQKKTESLKRIARAANLECIGPKGDR